MDLRLLWLVQGLALSTISVAGDLPAPAETDFVCPPLMTEKECTDYAHTLTRLPAGSERTVYLAAHAELMREREKACSCSQSFGAMARVAPASLQAVPRYRF